MVLCLTLHLQWLIYCDILRFGNFFDDVSPYSCVFSKRNVIVIFQILVDILLIYHLYSQYLDDFLTNRLSVPNIISIMSTTLYIDDISTNISDFFVYGCCFIKHAPIETLGNIKDYYVSHV